MLRRMRARGQAMGLQPLLRQAILAVVDHHRRLRQGSGRHTLGEMPGDEARAGGPP
jgi:hypothetical protein